MNVGAGTQSIERKGIKTLRTNKEYVFGENFVRTTRG